MKVLDDMKESDETLTMRERRALRRETGVRNVPVECQSTLEGRESL